MAGWPCATMRSNHIVPLLARQAVGSFVGSPVPSRIVPLRSLGLLLFKKSHLPVRHASQPDTIFLSLIFFATHLPNPQSPSHTDTVTSSIAPPPARFLAQVAIFPIDSSPKRSILTSTTHARSMRDARHASPTTVFDNSICLPITQPAISTDTQVAPFVSFESFVVTHDSPSHRVHKHPSTKPKAPRFCDATMQQ